MKLSLTPLVETSSGSNDTHDVQRRNTAEWEETSAAIGTVNNALEVTTVVELVQGEGGMGGKVQRTLSLRSIRARSVLP